MDKNNITVTLDYVVKEGVEEVGDMAAVLKELGYRYIIDYENNKYEILTDDELPADTLPLNHSHICFIVVKRGKYNQTVFHRDLFLLKKDSLPPRIIHYETVVNNGVVGILMCLNEETKASIYREVE